MPRRESLDPTCEAAYGTGNFMSTSCTFTIQDPGLIGPLEMGDIIIVSRGELFMRNIVLNIDAETKFREFLLSSFDILFSSPKV